MRLWWCVHNSLNYSQTLQEAHFALAECKYKPWTSCIWYLDVFGASKVLILSMFLFDSFLFLRHAAIWNITMYRTTMCLTPPAACLWNRIFLLAMIQVVIYLTRPKADLIHHLVPWLFDAIFHRRRKEFWRYLPLWQRWLHTPGTGLEVRTSPPKYVSSDRKWQTFLLIFIQCFFGDIMWNYRGSVGSTVQH